MTAESQAAPPRFSEPDFRGIGGNHPAEALFDAQGRLMHVSIIWH